MARVALQDKDWKVRRAAVQLLTDQAVLANVAIRDEQEVLNRAALAKITDQAALARVAVAGKGGLLEKDAISKEAIDKLTDQRLLMIVATRSRSTVDASSVSLELRLAAAEKITDQALLAKIAIEDDSSEVRAAALKNLTDQSALASEAIQDTLEITGFDAIRKITDRSAPEKLRQQPPAPVSAPTLPRSSHGTETADDRAPLRPTRRPWARCARPLAPHVQAATSVRTCAPPARTSG